MIATLNKKTSTPSSVYKLEHQVTVLNQNRIFKENLNTLCRETPKCQQKVYQVLVLTLGLILSGVKQKKTTDHYLQSDSLT